MPFLHSSPLRPMRLLRLPDPFDHEDFVYEVKFDGFRALAHINGHHCQLVSRNGHVLTRWPQLAEEIFYVCRCTSASAGSPHYAMSRITTDTAGADRASQ